MKFVNESMGPVISVPDPDQPWKEKLIRNPCLDKASALGSFEEYCRGHFQETYLKELRRMIDEGSLPVGKASRFIPEPDDIYLSEICIMNIQFGMDMFVCSSTNDLHTNYPPGYPFTVNMRAAVKAAITVGELWDDVHQTDTITQWYQVDGHVVFYEDHQEFSPIDRVSIYDKDRPPLENPLNEHLAPYIGNDGLDRIAHIVLQAYYQEALEKPTRVNAKKLARRIGLNIMPARLSDDNSRFGLLIMRDCYLMLDGKPTFVPARTILIDREACRKKRGGRTGWVIIHECIHFLLHRPFFEAQRLYNEELACLCCGTEKDLDKNCDLYWLEWQAEHIPPHLMIPAHVACSFIDSEYDKMRRCFPLADDSTIRTKLIPIIADLFYASKQCTEIRFRELGYGEDIKELVYDTAGTDSPKGRTDPGINTCEQIMGNGRDRNRRTIRKVITPARTTVLMAAEEPLPYGSTPHGSVPLYSVSLQELLEGGSDSRLIQILETGKYVYADTRFCLNDSAFIFHDEAGMPHLNGYALSHEEECCIPFWRRKQYAAYDTGAFHMDEIKGTVIVCGGDAKLKTASKEKPISQAYTDMKGVIENLPGSVGGTLKAHMDRIGVTVEDLEEFSHVSCTAIKDIRANRYGNMEFGFFIAICLGLKLEPPYSLDLIRKTRYRFDASHESTMYLLLLTTMYMLGVDACNEILIQNGLKPLTRKARTGNI